MRKISLKICGITNSQSVKTAYKNKIKSLGFASNNLNGPNTATDKKIQMLIKQSKDKSVGDVINVRGEQNVTPLMTAATVVGNADLIVFLIHFGLLSSNY